MTNKFYTPHGRYRVLTASRYRHLAHGQEGIVEEETVPPEDQAHGTYGALLFDKRWKAKRQEILARDNSRCVICQSEDNLQVHHRQYQYVQALKQFKAPWDYENHLLITLCEPCHTRGHSKFKVPSIVI